MVAASKGSTFSYRSHKDPILVIVPTRRSIYIYIDCYSSCKGSIILVGFLVALIRVC